MILSRPEAVLIVDDDDHYVRSLTRQLRELGFPFVYRATSAQQAVAMLERVHPTLVFTDVLMGHHVGGRGVIARATQLGASVAIMTSHPNIGAVELCIPIRMKSELHGKTLESLIFELIHEAQQRSRSSVRVAEQVA